jgi:peptide/nickel transport system permease protein
VVLLVVFLVCVALAPLLAPSAPNAVDYSQTLEAPTLSHPFGTDDQGRDVLGRVIHGTRVSFAIALIAVSLAVLLGIPAGLAAGFFGSWIDAAISRLLEALFAFPVILMAIAVLAILGPGERSAMVAIGVVAVPEFARVARAAMIAEKENEYVVAARAIGCTSARIIFRAILPNTLGPVLVVISLGFAFAILNETALSYLSLGAQPPTPSWGADLATGRRYLFDAPWLAFFPGMAIFCLVLALNLAGDGLRDLTDPRRRR